MTEQNNELTVKINQEIGLLNWNFEELNKQLDEQLKKYAGLQFNDDEIAEAKKTRANLNNVKKAIDNRRLEVKKQFCKPYDDFAEQAKKLTTKIDSVNAGIDAQIKTAELKQDEKKKQDIEAYWKEIGEASRLVRLDQVWDERYLNKTFNESQWKSDLDEKAAQIVRDTDTIAKMDHDQLNFMSTDYFKTLNLGESLAHWQNHLDELKRTEEFRQRAEVDRLARQKALEEQQASVEQSTVTEETASPAQENKPSREELWAVMEVSGTREQMVEMTAELKRIGLTFHVKEKGTREI